MTPRVAWLFSRELFDRCAKQPVAGIVGLTAVLPLAITTARLRTSVTTTDGHVL
jgi:hypothetical protein